MWLKLSLAQAFIFFIIYLLVMIKRFFDGIRFVLRTYRYVEVFSSVVIVSSYFADNYLSSQASRTNENQVSQCIAIKILFWKKMQSKF